MNDRNKSTAHTTWNCKYHIVFAPKFRRKILYNQKRELVGRIHRKLCEWKDVEIIEAEVCPDHIHMLVAIPPKLSVSSFMGYLKGKRRPNKGVYPTTVRGGQTGRTTVNVWQVVPVYGLPSKDPCRWQIAVRALARCWYCRATPVYEEPPASELTPKSWTV